MGFQGLSPLGSFPPCLTSHPWVERVSGYGVTSLLWLGSVVGQKGGDFASVIKVPNQVGPWASLRSYWVGLAWSGGDHFLKRDPPGGLAEATMSLQEMNSEQALQWEGSLAHILDTALGHLEQWTQLSSLWMADAQKPGVKEHGLQSLRWFPGNKHSHRRSGSPSWNCSRATVGVWLHKSVFSTEGRHHLSCKETDRKCCCGSHPARSELSPLGDGQAVGLKERLWNITQRASENHRLHLTKGHSSFHFSPLPSPLSLRVAPERAAGRTQVFWHPRAHS